MPADVKEERGAGEPKSTWLTSRTKRVLMQHALKEGSMRAARIGESGQIGRESRRWGTNTEVPNSVVHPKEHAACRFIGPRVVHAGLLQNWRHRVEF